MFFCANTHCLLGRNGKKRGNEIEKYESTEENGSLEKCLQTPMEEGGARRWGPRALSGQYSLTGLDSRVDACTPCVFRKFVSRPR